MPRLVSFRGLILIFWQASRQFHTGVPLPGIDAVVDPGFLRRGGVADLKERQQNNRRQSRLSDGFVPFLNFKP